MKPVLILLPMFEILFSGFEISCPAKENAGQLYASLPVKAKPDQVSTICKYGLTNNTFDELRTKNSFAFDESFKLTRKITKLKRTLLSKEIIASLLNKTVNNNHRPDYTIHGTSNRYYVSPVGNDNNPGTLEKPFATWQKGFTSLRTGDTLFIRGGIYHPSGTFSGDNKCGVAVSDLDGLSDRHIVVINYPNENPVLDCSKIRGPYNRLGLSLNYSDFWEIIGLTIRNVKDTSGFMGRGIALYQSNDIVYKSVTVHDCGDGFTTSGISDNNFWINCDSYNNSSLNYDGGDLANGFSLSQYGSGNSPCHIYMQGCRAWNNSDDGFDFLNSDVDYNWGYHGAYIYINNCWAWGNGYGKAGNGVGFKLGGVARKPVDGGIQRIVANCLSWNNASIGFDESAGNQFKATMDMLLFNNIAYNHRKSWGMGFAFHYPYDGGDVFLRSNISFHNNENFLGRKQGISSTGNTWNLKSNITKADFLSLDDSGAYDPRKADGSLPDLLFLKLAPGSVKIFDHESGFINIDSLLSIKGADIFNDIIIVLKNVKKEERTNIPWMFEWFIIFWKTLY